MKAVIAFGEKQHIVEKDDELLVDVIEKTTSIEPLMIIDDEKISIGNPTVKGALVKFKILKEERDKKVTAIRYKAKKRVKKIHGHRQHKTRIKITGIESKENS
jgi:large subunit ribosomal protein L21